MRKENKIFYWIVIIGIMLSFIPMIYICQYNCPSADDYNYATTTFKMWNETHSVPAVFIEAVNTSLYFWNNWQGLYISAFLLALQPALFGVKWYALTGIIMLLLIIGSTVAFSNYFVCRLFQRSRLEGMTVGLVLSFFMIQYMPSCVEGIYWFNGAVNYGFFFAVLLIYICALIELQMENTKLKEMTLLLGCIFFVFILEGGNHITALMGTLFTAVVLVISFRKNGKKTIENLVLLCVALIFLYINLSSPGTAVRYNAINATVKGYGLLETVVAATYKGIESVVNWLGLKEIVMVVILLPILNEIVQYARENTKIQFKYPLLVLIASVAWICIMYCPPYMGMRSAGQGRLINIVYYSFIILFLINAIYILGWLQRMLQKEYIQKISTISIKYVFTAMILVVAILISEGKISWGYQSIVEVCNGEAEQYSKEFIEREELIKIRAEEDLIVPSLSVYPRVLFFDDITEDELDWKNIAAARYYGLNSIATE